MTEPTTTAAPLCAYPGCTRPPAPAPLGAGRPSRYCGQDDGTRIHNRQTARAARQERAATSTDVATGEPVTMARASAALLIERLETALSGQAQILAEALEQIRTMGDPTAVQAELTSVTTTARAEAEQARAEAAAAEQTRVAAEAARAAAEADRADADDATADAEQARDAAEQARDAAEQARAATAATARGLAEALDEANSRISVLAGDYEQLDQELASTVARLTQAEQDTATQQARAEQAEATRASLAAELRAAITSHNAEQARAQAAENLVALLRARIEDLVDARAQTRTELASVTSRLTEVATELDAARHQVSALEQAAAVAAHQHTTDTATIAGLREELDAVRAEAGSTRARLEARHENDQEHPKDQ